MLDPTHIAGALPLLILIFATPAAHGECLFSESGHTMRLEADCETESTIYVPDGWTLNGQGHTITAVEISEGAWNGAVVRNEGVWANVLNLGIRTADLACICNSREAPDERLRGILLEDAGGLIRDNVIQSTTMAQPCGCQEGNGIEVRHEPYDGRHPDTLAVKILDNTVTGYQKNGITVNGDLKALVNNNEVIGIDPTDAIAQNGIQFGYGARGTAMDNGVDGNWYTGADWTSTGILVFESDDVLLLYNRVRDSQVGVAVEAWCWLAPSASGNWVIHNEIEGAQFGLSITASNLGGYSACDASADNNLAAFNTLSGPDGELGIYVGSGESFCPCDALTPEAADNALLSNEIDGFLDGIVDEGTDTWVVESSRGGLRDAGARTTARSDEHTSSLSMPSR